MSQSTKKYWTPEEYLAREEAALEKHEYFEGEIYEMAGNTSEHSEINANTMAALIQAFRGHGCRVFDSNLRIRVKSNGLFTYPDALVVCGRLDYVLNRRDTITNPTIIIEILSRSTSSYDRSKKFELYKGLPSFTDYLLISSSEVKIEYRYKMDNGEWEAEIFTGLDEMIKFKHVATELALRDIYAEIDFED